MSFPPPLAKIFINQMFIKELLYMHVYQQMIPTKPHLMNYRRTIMKIW